MTLTLSQKEKVVEEIVEKLGKSEWMMLANPVGLTVASVSELRKKLYESKIDYTVYKNTLIRRAIEQNGDAGLQKLIPHLKGPTGLAITESCDPIVATKIFTDFAKTAEKLEVKAAVFQGDYWDTARTVEMAKLGSMASIYGMLISAMKNPANKLVNTLNGPMMNLVLTLKAVAEKG